MSILSLLATTDYNYSYSYSSPTMTSGESAAVMATIVMVSIIIGLATYVIVAFFISRIFKKAGVEGWKAWVPVYNTWVTLELGGQAGWWAVLAFIPIVNIASVVFIYIAMYNIGLKLGKSGVFVLWAIFIPLVWYIWLAMDSSRWNPVVGAPLRLATTPDNTSTPPSGAPTATE
jgi:hypothetical protein